MAKPGKSPVDLLKAAGTLADPGKDQRKPWGMLEGSRAPCRLWESLEKAVKTLWKAEEPHMGLRKARQKLS